MKPIILELPDLDATECLGIVLGENASPGEIITLSGDLGAGKTTLTQFIGKGLGIPRDSPITSPTFSLLHEYDGRLPLYHMDLYRLAGQEDVETLGFEEYIYGDGLTVIEWADRLGDMLPQNRLDIALTLQSGPARTALIALHGLSWEQKIALILEKCRPQGFKFLDQLR